MHIGRYREVMVSPSPICPRRECTVPCESSSTAQHLIQSTVQYSTVYSTHRWEHDIICTFLSTSFARITSGRFVRTAPEPKPVSTVEHDVSSPMCHISPPGHHHLVMNCRLFWHHACILQRYVEYHPQMWHGCGTRYVLRYLHGR